MADLHLLYRVPRRGVCAVFTKDYGGRRHKVFIYILPLVADFHAGRNLLLPIAFNPHNWGSLFSVQHLEKLRSHLGVFSGGEYSGGKKLLWHKVFLCSCYTGGMGMGRMDLKRHVLDESLLNQRGQSFVEYIILLGVVV